MTNRIAAIALITSLASSLALASGQNSAPHSSAETRIAATSNVAVKKAKQKDSIEKAYASDDAKSKNKNRQVQPGPSKEEQEFEKSLMGIYGG